MDNLTKFIILILAILIITYPNFNSKNKFRVNMACNGKLNIFITVLLLVMLLVYDYKIGLFASILFFSIIYTNSNKYEGFVNYFSK